MRIGQPARTARHTVCLSRPPCGTPVAATLPGALSCPPPRPFRQRASPEQREAPLRNHSTHIRTVSGGSPAIFRPLTPLTVPLSLKPLFLLDGAGPRLCGLWAEEDWTPRLLARSSEVLAVANRLAFDGFDVDHVAVTPAGARGGDQMGGQPERRALVGRARPSGRGRRTQDPLAAAQQTIGRSDLPVVPVLVLWGPGSRTLKGQAVEWDGVTVLPAQTPSRCCPAGLTGPVTVGDAGRSRPAWRLSSRCESGPSGASRSARPGPSAPPSDALDGRRWQCWPPFSRPLRRGSTEPTTSPVESEGGAAGVVVRTTLVVRTRRSGRRTERTSAATGEGEALKPRPYVHAPAAAPPRREAAGVRRGCRGSSAPRRRIGRLARRFDVTRGPPGTARPRRCSAGAAVRGWAETSRCHGTPAAAGAAGEADTARRHDAAARATAIHPPAAAVRGSPTARPAPGARRPPTGWCRSWPPWPAPREEPAQRPAVTREPATGCPAQ